MIEIKFRGWEKNLKEMIPVNNIDFESRIINTNGPWRKFGEIELMQYTGLTDKNGTEIYEGDIVRYGFGNKKGQVVWDRYVWTIRYFYCSAYDYPSLAFSEDFCCEVIGNIYDNPELLN